MSLILVFTILSSVASSALRSDQNAFLKIKCRESILVTLSPECSQFLHPTSTSTSTSTTTITETTHNHTSILTTASTPIHINIHSNASASGTIKAVSSTLSSLVMIYASIVGFLKYRMKWSICRSATLGLHGRSQSGGLAVRAVDIPVMTRNVATV